MKALNTLLLVMVAVSMVYGETIVPTVNPTGTLATSAATKSVTSSNTTVPSQKISIKLERPPVYAYPGIITDFLITPALERTQDDIENMFTYEFSDTKFLPPRMYVSVGERNDQIRVMFDYQNDIPFKPFSVRFKVTDQKNPVLSTGSISIVYDSISGGISSALHIGGQNEDFIR